MATRSPAHGPGRGSWGPSDQAARARNAGYRDGVNDEQQRAAGYRGHAATGYRDRAAGRDRGRRHRRDATGGAEGNERLTALTGMALLVLFAAEGVTILSVRRMLTLHFFLGMLLIGPVALKACSTIYRFVRYYTGAAAYRRKGPPAPLLRMLGPVVVLTSVAVIGTGVMLSAAAMAQPKNVALANQVAAVFKGTTLRGMLLNAYGWWQMGQILLISAIVAFCSAGLFLILSGLGFWHLRRTTPEAEIFPKTATRVMTNA